MADEWTRRSDGGGGGWFRRKATFEVRGCKRRYVNEVRDYRRPRTTRVSPSGWVENGVKRKSPRANGPDEMDAGNR